MECIHYRWLIKINFRKKRKHCTGKQYSTFLASLNKLCDLGQIVSFSKRSFPFWKCLDQTQSEAPSQPLILEFYDIQDSSVKQKRHWEIPISLISGRFPKILTCNLITLKSLKNIGILLCYKEVHYSFIATNVYFSQLSLQSSA